MSAIKTCLARVLMLAVTSLARVDLFGTCINACCHQVTWLACWKENVLGNFKYVMLNPTSKLKGEKDHAKYETARKLKVCQWIHTFICGGFYLSFSLHLNHGHVDVMNNFQHHLIYSNSQYYVNATHCGIKKDWPLYIRI